MERHHICLPEYILTGIDLILLQMAQWADRLVEILAKHYVRLEFRIFPPKMHSQFRISLPKMHVRFPINPPKWYILYLYYDKRTDTL